jgi:hypothetical protein
MISNPAQPPFDIHANSLLATFSATPRRSYPTRFYPLLKNAAFSRPGPQTHLPWRAALGCGQLPGSPHAVPVSEIFAALRDLDDVDPPPVAGVLRVPVVDEPAMAVGF